MAEEDVFGDVVAAGDAGDGEASDWVAPEVIAPDGLVMRSTGDELTQNAKVFLRGKPEQVWVPSDEELDGIGYALEACPLGLHWRRQVRWSGGVWRRQAELQPPLTRAKDPSVVGRLKALVEK